MNSSSPETSAADCKRLLDLPEEIVLLPTDWENIPTPVPSAIQSLQHEIAGLARVVREVLHAEQVAESRFNPLEESELLHMKLTKNAADVARAVGEVRTLGNVQEELWSQLNKTVRDSEKMMLYVKETKGSELGKLVPKEEPQTAALAMWSVHGLKKLITDTVNESEMKQLIEAREFDLMHIDDEIAQIIKFNEKLIANVGTETEALHRKIVETTRTQEDGLAKLLGEQRETQKHMDDALGEVAAIRGLSSQIKANDDVIVKRMAELNERLEKQSADMGGRVDNAVRRVKKRKTEIGEMAKNHKEMLGTFAALTERIDKQDRLLEFFKEAVEEQKRLKQLEASMTKSKNELKALVTETIEGIRTDMKETRSEVYRKLGENDDEIKSLLKKMDTVTDSLEQWALKVIKPAQSNEAKIFALETRLREEETQRMQESGKLRDNIKKIIYAFEQYSIGRVDKENDGSPRESEVQSDTNKSDEESALSILPPLNSNKEPTPVKRIFDTSLVVDSTSAKHRRESRRKENKSFAAQKFEGPEFLLLKRLRYLKMLVTGSIDFTPEILTEGYRTANAFARVPPVGEASSTTAYGTKQFRFRRRRRMDARKAPIELFVEARKAVQEPRQQRRSKERKNDVESEGEGPGFDYRSEKHKYGTFRRYVEAIKPQPPSAPAPLPLPAPQSQTLTENASSKG